MKKEYFCVNDIYVNDTLVARSGDELFLKKGNYVNSEKEFCCQLEDRCAEKSVIVLD